MSPQPVRASDAWIDPNGGFYPVPDCGHNAAAIEIVREEWGEHNIPYPGDHLENVGWVHLSCGTVQISQELTQSQIDTLYDVLNAFRAEGSVRAAWLEDSLRKHGVGNA